MEFNGSGCSILTHIALSLLLSSGPPERAEVWVCWPPPSCLATLCFSHCSAVTWGSLIFLRGSLFLPPGLCTCSPLCLDISATTSLQVSARLSPSRRGLSRLVQSLCLMSPPKSCPSYCLLKMVLSTLSMILAEHQLRGGPCLPCPLVNTQCWAHSRCSNNMWKEGREG